MRILEMFNYNMNFLTVEDLSYDPDKMLENRNSMVNKSMSQLNEKNN